MGKATRWLRSFLGLKKEGKQSHQYLPSHTDDNNSKETRLDVPQVKTKLKEKRRWSFGKSSRGHSSTTVAGPGLCPEPIAEAKASCNEHSFGAENEQNKHAIAVAAATAAAADAAVAAAHAAAAVVRLTSSGFSFVSEERSREEYAAIRIQTAFRGYLARKALSALKGLVKLQALVRGHIVRKQATETLRCMQSLVTIQARVRARSLRMSEGGQASQSKLMQRRHQEFRPSKSSERRNPSTGSLNEREGKAQSRQDARVRSGRELFHVFPQREMENSSLDGSTKIVEMDTNRSSSKKWIGSMTDSLSIEQSISSNSATQYPPHDNWRLQSSQQAHSLPHYKGFTSAESFHGMTSELNRLSIPRAGADMLTAPVSQDFSPGTVCADYDYGEDSVFSTAQSSPQFSSAKFGGKRGPFTPRSEYAESLFEGYSAFPNYMANTESSKAKVRSHSAPKQRPASYERNTMSSRRRMSLQGAVDDRSSVTSERMQRSSSQVPSVRKGYQYAGPVMLDRSTVPLKDGQFETASTTNCHY